MNDYTCKDCAIHEHVYVPDMCKNQDKDHQPCKDFQPADYIKALNYDAINPAKKVTTMNDLRDEIKAWKQSNQQLDMENLRLKYWLFATMFINLIAILKFIYESLN
jgi:hypothetical protein